MNRWLLVLVVLALLPRTATTADPAVCKFDGVWEVTALIDDGDVVSAKLIKETLSRNGCVTIRDQSIVIERPTGAQRTLLFIADPVASPPTIDLAGADKVGSKGIFLHSGDTLMLCLGGPGIDLRPTEFSSKAGSHTILMTLKRAAVANDVAVAKVTPIPTPVIADDATRRALIGTWGHQNSDAVELGTFTADGLFNMSKTWKNGMKKLFDGDLRASGTWHVTDGVLSVKITATTDKDMQGQVYTYRINSISDKDLILIDQRGQVRREWKTR